MQETEAQTTIECPEGHIYKCALIGDVTVYKGKGVTVIKPKEDK